MTPKDKYWINGNIFVLSTGVKRFVWNTRLIDKSGYIPKDNFNDELVNTDSTVGEEVILVYSPNSAATYFEDLLKTEDYRLLWQKYDVILTKEAVREKFGIAEDTEFIVIGK